MGLVDKNRVLTIVNYYLMNTKDYDDYSDLFGHMIDDILSLEDECESTPQSVINFFIDEEQAKKYMKAIIKTDADNQIKFINYHEAAGAHSKDPASPHYY